MTWTFWLTIAMLAVLSTIIVALSRGEQTRESFYVHNRVLGKWRGAITLTSAWTQPLALFASAVFAYRSIWHFLAFAVPNVVGIGLKVWQGPALRRAYEKGFTLPEVWERRFPGVAGKSLRTVFAIVAFISIAYTLALSLTMLQGASQSALRSWMGEHLGIGVFTFSVIIVAFGLLWPVRNGIRGAVLGDITKMLVTLIGVAGIGILWIFAVPAPEAARQSVAAFSPMAVFWGFGVPFSISLIGGALMNPDMIERDNSIDRKEQVRSYVGATVLFTVILVSYGSLGFLARGLGLQLTSNELPAIAIAARIPYADVSTLLLVAVILTASIASSLATAANVGGVELYSRFVTDPSERWTLVWSRVFMFAAAVGGFAMAFYVGDISVLLSNMSIVRGELLVPLVLMLWIPHAVSPWTIFISVIAGAAAGVYCTFVLHAPSLGALSALLVPAIVCAISSALCTRAVAQI